MAVPDDFRFRRRGATRPTRRWLIVSEDEKSSSFYLKRFFTNQRYACFDVVGGAGNTLSVVQRGIELANKARLEKNPYVHTWCVFDRDDHPPARFNDAIQLARSQTEFSAIWSNESFELWYLLHYDFLQSSLKRHEINERLARRLGRAYSKSDEGIYDELMKDGGSRLEIAMRNAEKLMADGRSPQSNPSLLVHLMIREIQSINAELSASR